ncbi:hypothetical protein B0T17DRAFT_524391 [Bombardia bombarda]|uniref:N-acetyltransferase domain-containing protein n=1 Tax=Bombardia bombarda TaxID=252184 RepID=A0AA39X8E6_9PEZI|nr:hypothetical protein B0T17DRAFT_524391 [Bombardia bombarda]
MPQSNQQQPRTWTRQVGDTTYMCSTDQQQIQLDALNAAFESDMIWWAKGLTTDALRRSVENSFCFGLYVRTAAGGDGEREWISDMRDTSSSYAMIGFARLVTDYVTVGYLTDVYVLQEHQGKGLGTWLMGCVNETLSAWPDLRGIVIIVGEVENARLYQKTLNARIISEPLRAPSAAGEGADSGYFVMETVGPAAVEHPAA